jgi:hypothetical protein
MNSRRRISALRRFVGNIIAIRDALEPVLMAACVQLMCNVSRRRHARMIEVAAIPAVGGKSMIRLSVLEVQ